MSLEVHIEKKLNGFTLRSDLTAGNTATAILGASGCGKSMTLRCIAGIVKPDKGRILLDGRVLFDSEQHIDLPPQQRGVGLLFQNYALFPNMTVEQNILCGLNAEKDRAARKARCAEMLRAMRLEELAKLPLALQVNADTLLRWRTRRQGLELLELTATPLLGSDCHDMTKRPPNLKGGREMVRRKLGEAFLAQMDENARRLTTPTLAQV